MSVRYTVAPAPAQFETVQRLCNALPERAEAVDDCCGTLQDAGGLSSRAIAREWLVFLQALDLASKTGRGYQRSDVPLRRETASTAFLETIYAVRETLDILDTANQPLSVADVCVELPSTTRDRTPGITSQLTWETYTKRLLEWCTVFGLATVTPEGYRS